MNGQLYSSSRREKANILNDQLKSVFTTENLTDFSAMGISNMPDMGRITVFTKVRAYPSYWHNFPAIGISNMPGMGRNTVTTKNMSNLLA